jgi:large subunit ribosomal protein L17
MKHRKVGHKLNRTTKHREALYKNLSLSLFEHGAIKTTEAKAKAVSRFVDKLITQAKKNTISARRELARSFGKRQSVNHLVDVVAPQIKRTSGFTRTVRLGKRQGDDTMMVRMELLDYKKPVVVKKTSKKSVKKVPVKKTAKKAIKKSAPAIKPVSQKPKSPNLPVKQVRKNLSKV